MVSVPFACVNGVRRLDRGAPRPFRHRIVVVVELFTLRDTRPGFHAAFAATLLTILFALYVIPYGVIVDTFSYFPEADIRAGDAYFEPPAPVVLWVRADGSTLLDFKFVPSSQLVQELTAARLHGSRSLQLRADRRVKLGTLAPVLTAIRLSGFNQFYVLGPHRSILELQAREPGA